MFHFTGYGYLPFLGVLPDTIGLYYHFPHSDCNYLSSLNSKSFTWFSGKSKTDSSKTEGKRLIIANKLMFQFLNCFCFECVKNRLRRWIWYWCWPSPCVSFPQHLFYMWFYFDSESQQNYDYSWHIFRIVAFCLGFGNSCLNPILLYCMSQKFRKVRGIFSFVNKMSFKLYCSGVPNVWKLVSIRYFYNGIYTLLRLFCIDYCCFQSVWLILKLFCSSVAEKTTTKYSPWNGFGTHSLVTSYFPFTSYVCRCEN